jgi:hypothetical protein
MSSRCPLLRGGCSFSDVLIGGCPNHGPCTRVAASEAVRTVSGGEVDMGRAWASLGDPGASEQAQAGREEASP